MDNYVRYLLPQLDEQSLLTFRDISNQRIRLSITSTLNIDPPNEDKVEDCP